MKGPQAAPRHQRTTPQHLGANPQPGQTTPSQRLRPVLSIRRHPSTSRRPRPARPRQPTPGRPAQPHQLGQQTSDRPARTRPAPSQGIPPFQAAAQPMRHRRTEAPHPKTATRYRPTTQRYPGTDPRPGQTTSAQELQPVPSIRRPTTPQRPQTAPPSRRRTPGRSPQPHQVNRRTAGHTAWNWTTPPWEIPASTPAAQPIRHRRTEARRPKKAPRYPRTAQRYPETDLRSRPAIPGRRLRPHQTRRRPAGHPARRQPVPSWGGPPSPGRGQPTRPRRPNPPVQGPPDQTHRRRPGQPARRHQTAGHPTQPRPRTAPLTPQTTPQRPLTPSRPPQPRQICRHTPCHPTRPCPRTARRSPQARPRDRPAAPHRRPVPAYRQLAGRPFRLSAVPAPLDSPFRGPGQPVRRHQKFSEQPTAAPRSSRTAS
jgi:hypothetical protein